MEKLTVTYSTIKQIITTIPSYFILQGDDGYSLFCVGDDSVVSCHVSGDDDSSKTDFATNYMSACISVASQDDALVLGRVSNSKPFVGRRDKDGTTRASMQKPDYSKLSFYTHNFCDPTSWYQGSVRVVGEIATPDGYYTTYSLSHVNIIDTLHGKLTQEDYLDDGQGGNYRVLVSVDGYAKSEQDPHYASGGDYIIDYVNGKIMFLNALSAENVVSVTYWYATISTFTIAALPNQNIKMEIAEVQFSKDISVIDSILFEVWGYVDAFAPELVGTGDGQIPSGTKIMITNPSVYKGLNDLQNDSMKTYCEYPPLGMSTKTSGQEWRACLQPVLVFDWDYVSCTTILGSVGMEIRIRLQHDRAFEGYFATCSIYSSLV